MSMPLRLLALALVCAALAAAPARAQDDETPAAAAPPAAKKTKAAKKPAAKPSPRGAKPRTASASSAARKYPLETSEIAALSDALGSFLAEKSVQPLVLQEPGDDDQLTVAMQVLEESLDAQLKKSDRQPLTPAATSTAQGLANLLDEIATGAARPAASPAPSATGGEVVATAAAAELPSVDPAAASASEPAPPPPERVVRMVDTAPPSAAAPEPGATGAVRYTLAKVLVSRDGGQEQEVPIPSGGPVRPVPLAHRGGNPPVELKLVLKLPAVLDLGESVQVAAQAHIAAPGAAAELSLANEVLDTVRAEGGADAAAAAGTVSYSFMKRVGGVFAYQQTFAQGDGRGAGTVPPRSILFNWTDREPSIELPFAWSASAPAAVSLRGRAIYAPAARP